MYWLKQYRNSYAGATTDCLNITKGGQRLLRRGRDQRYILVGFLRSPRLLEQLGDRLPSEEAL